MKCPEGCKSVHGNTGRVPTPAQLAALEAGRKKLCEKYCNEKKEVKKEKLEARLRRQAAEAKDTKSRDGFLRLAERAKAKGL